MKKVIFICLMGIISFFSSCFVGKSKKIVPGKDSVPVHSIYDIQIKSIDGSSEIKMSDYKGKYIVIVNTASECGYTYQYKDMQEFYVRFKDSGIVVLGCPCNQFGSQEPGTLEEIDKFCKEKYNVTFPMTEKIDVKGSGQHPLYEWLTRKEKNGAGDFEVRWNFNKFIVDPQGHLVQYFGSATKPFDREFLDAVKKYTLIR